MCLKRTHKSKLKRSIGSLFYVSQFQSHTKLQPTFLYMKSKEEDNIQYQSSIRFSDKQFLQYPKIGSKKINTTNQRNPSTYRENRKNKECHSWTQPVFQSGKEMGKENHRLNFGRVQKVIEGHTPFSRNNSQDSEQCSTRK